MKIIKKMYLKIIVKWKHLRSKTVKWNDSPYSENYGKTNFCFICETAVEHEHMHKHVHSYKYAEFRTIIYFPPHGIQRMFYNFQKETEKKRGKDLFSWLCMSQNYSYSNTVAIPHKNVTFNLVSRLETDHSN